MYIKLAQRPHALDKSIYAFYTSTTAHPQPTPAQQHLTPDYGGHFAKHKSKSEPDHSNIL